jgi:hypothetical protein
LKALVWYALQSCGKQNTLLFDDAASSHCTFVSNLPMYLNQVKSISFEHTSGTIAAVYFLSSDAVWGQPIHGSNIWLAIAFSKGEEPETRFKLAQPAIIKKQPVEVIEVIVKREIRLYLAAQEKASEAERGTGQLQWS